MRVALIKAGVVENVIEAEEGFVIDGFTMLPIDNNESCGPGFTYDGDTFSAPQPVPTRTLSPRSFLALFTSQELDAIEDAAHPIARASKRMLYTLTADVELDSPELAVMLEGLRSIGLLTAERVSEILEGQV